MAFDRSAVDLGVQRIDRNAALGHADIADEPQRLLGAANDVVAALHPGEERIGIGGVDIEGASEIGG